MIDVRATGAGIDNKYCERTISRALERESEREKERDEVKVSVRVLRRRINKKSFRALRRYKQSKMKKIANDPISWLLSKEDEDIKLDMIFCKEKKKNKYG